MSYLTVAAEDIRKGDQINMGPSFALNPNHRWANVRKVKRLTDDVEKRIMIFIIGRTILLDPKEKVSIQRFDDLES